MSPQLLIAEDDRSLRQMLCWEFEDLGYRVTATDCCVEAMLAAGEVCFDLALLDFDLPDGLGTELMAKLLQRWPDLPVVMYSGRATAGETESALRDGARRFVCKPVASLTLHRIFQQLLPPL